MRQKIIISLLGLICSTVIGYSQIDSLEPEQGVDYDARYFLTKTQKNSFNKIFPDFETKKAVGEKLSFWHKPPKHKWRHVKIMMHTPTCESAMNNLIHYPQKADGTRIKGHKNTYKRQCWEKPAYTITTYNGAICSYDNVHPGKKISNDIYTEARVLTIYEIMLVMSIPTDWNLPKDTKESLIRHTIGEGIPPLMVNKIIECLLKKIEIEDSSNEK